MNKNGFDIISTDRPIDFKIMPKLFVRKLVIFEHRKMYIWTLPTTINNIFRMDTLFNILTYYLKFTNNLINHSSIWVDYQY